MMAYPVAACFFLCEVSQKVYFIQKLLKHDVKQKLTGSWCITLLLPLNQELK